MAYGEYHEGNKTNRLMRLGGKEIGNFRQLWSERSLLRIWHLSQDLKDDSKPSHQKLGRSTPGRGLFKGVGQKPVWLKSGSKWGGFQEVEDKPYIAPWLGKQIGYYSLKQVLNIFNWMIDDIIYKCVYISCVLGPGYTVSQNLAIGTIYLLSC